jgi:hypothetical protein
MWSASSDATRPGSTLVTRTPSGPNSVRRFADTWVSTAFVAV